jgi:hypothetical protein
MITMKQISARYLLKGGRGRDHHVHVLQSPEPAQVRSKIRSGSKSSVQEPEMQARVQVDPQIIVQQNNQGKADLSKVPL